MPDHVLHERYTALTREPIDIRRATWVCLWRSMLSDEDIQEVLRVKVKWRVLLGRYMRQPISEVENMTAREIREYIEVLHEVVSDEHATQRDRHE